MSADSVVLFHHLAGASTDSLMSVVSQFHNLRTYSLCPLMLFSDRVTFDIPVPSFQIVGLPKRRSDRGQESFKCIL